MRRSPWSLRARLLVVSVTVLLVFVALTGVAVDRAFRDSADAAQMERLEALLFLLMGTLDVAGDGALSMPAQLPEPRLAVPGSGLYAHIDRRDAGAAEGAGPEQRVRPPSTWVSVSAVGKALPFIDTVVPGEQRSEVRAAADGTDYRVIARGVRWEIGDPPSAITFSIATPLASRGVEVGAYRRSLWSALALMAGLLLVSLVAVQHWGLGPLRRLARSLAAMEAGEVRDVGGPYPAELAPLAANLDRVLHAQRAMMDRHRAALGDLAHSLKTPLAVLRGAPADDSLAELVHTQTRRMDDIVHYQLQRASTAGASQSAPPVPFEPLLERLLASMEKVHRARGLRFERDIAPGLQARIDEGDALELLGNLVDNACKWARSRVRVSAQRSGGALVVSVEDDGPGIADPALVVGRGARGDERTPGHGIGLAMVSDIALAYSGEVHIDRSGLGGARLRLVLGAC